MKSIAKKKSAQYKHVGVRMPIELEYQLRKLASQDRRNLSDFLRIKLEELAASSKAA